MPVLTISGGDNFLYGFKPGRHGPDAPPLHPASARSRLRLRERAGRLARDEGVNPRDMRGVVVASGRGRRGLCGAAPSVKPAARPDPTSPSAGGSLGTDHYGGERGPCGGAGGIGSNGLTLGPLRLLGRRCRQARRGLP